MLDCNTWVDLLSFIQISVALNLGYVLIKHNPFSELFNTYIILDPERNCNLSIDNFRKEYGELLDKCAKANRTSNLESLQKYNSLTTKYLNAYKLFERITVCEKLDTICFPYACLLLGLYGLMGLYIIPHCEKSYFVHFYILLTLCVIFTLFVLLIIEIVHRVHQEPIIKPAEKKYFFIEILLIAGATIILTYITNCIPDNFYNFIINNLCFYDVSGCLSYISFIICFILGFIDNFKIKRIKQNLNKNLVDFKSEYVKLQALLNSLESSNLPSNEAD